ncbi:hypothetical protein FQN60_015762, partial [Etheostoma spectabile]
PPNLTVPRGKSPLVAREGDTVELECLVSGKPKPIILWSRADKEAPMPDGSMQMESYDGVLRIVNVSREMTGSYRCQTSQYNGFNVKPREAVVELIVQSQREPSAFGGEPCAKPRLMAVYMDHGEKASVLLNVVFLNITVKVSTDPPTVEPVYMEMRQGLGRSVVMSCRVLRAHPSRVLRFEWLLSNRLLHAGAFDAQRDETDYTIRSLNRDGWGEYTCNVINEAGAGKCTFQVTGLGFCLLLLMFHLPSSYLHSPFFPFILHPPFPLSPTIAPFLPPNAPDSHHLDSVVAKGKAYPVEFYYDTYSPLWQNRPRVYGFKLQWTQMNPNAVDRIVAYRLGIRQCSRERQSGWRGDGKEALAVRHFTVENHKTQITAPVKDAMVGLDRWWEQEIPVDGAINKGELMTHNLTELIKPESYEVRLTPITRFGEGDSTVRIVTYSEPQAVGRGSSQDEVSVCIRSGLYGPLSFGTSLPFFLLLVHPPTLYLSLCYHHYLREFHCSFEEEPICMFTQDKNDDFDWTRHSAATRDTKYTPNTGPSFYMYIETSRPRKEGDQARLVSPFFNVAPKNPYGITNPPAYCFSFFYHMYGKHIEEVEMSRWGGRTKHLERWRRGRWREYRIEVSMGNSAGRCELLRLPAETCESQSHQTWHSSLLKCWEFDALWDCAVEVVLEGIRGPGIEGDIAIDDVTLEEGECRDPPPSE